MERNFRSGNVCSKERSSDWLGDLSREPLTARSLRARDHYEPDACRGLKELRGAEFCVSTITAWDERDGNPQTKTGRFGAIQNWELVGPEGKLIERLGTSMSGPWAHKNAPYSGGSIPPGTYTIKPDMGVDTMDPKQRAFVSGSVGYKFPLEMIDPVTQKEIANIDVRMGHAQRRTELRIHPMAGAGTNGCSGIMGSRETQLYTRDTVRAVIRANGGRGSVTFY